MQEDLLSRYTPAFLSMHPQHKQIPEKLAQVEGAIREKAQIGSRAMLSQAEQANVSRQQAVAELQQKIVELKGESSEFTKHFVEQETMRADLERLVEDASRHSGKARADRIQAAGVLSTVASSGARSPADTAGISLLLAG